MMTGLLEWLPAGVKPQSLTTVHTMQGIRAPESVLELWGGGGGRARASAE
jgi:hypothetical protein